MFFAVTKGMEVRISDFHAVFVVFIPVRLAVRLLAGAGTGQRSMRVDLDRAKACAQQRWLYERALAFRIKQQKALSAANTLPQACYYAFSFHEPVCQPLSQNDLSLNISKNPLSHS